ncbi:hypothetical protein EBGED10_44090 [Bacillus sp. GeD10]|nr:hypothetical protein EBGED10_44090 [Bacillus sp. GeD10]
MSGAGTARIPSFLSFKLYSSAITLTAVERVVPLLPIRD